MSSKKVLIDLKPDNRLINQDFEGYKLSLEPVPTFDHEFKTGVYHVEPSADQYSFQHVRLFGLHNHLYGDPWSPNDLFYFNEQGKLIKSTWDSISRRFDSTEVWSEPELAASTTDHIPGDYNYSLSMDCRDKIFILNGKQNGTLFIVNTGNREKRTAEWSKDCVTVSSLPAGILMSCAVTGLEGGRPSFHCLVQSVVEATTISELQMACKQPGGTFATLLQWITLSQPVTECGGDSGGCSVETQRNICVHGVVDYATFEANAEAVYIASQKKAFFASDSTRPVTPLMERMLRKRVRYTWDQNDSEVSLNFVLPAPASEQDIEVSSAEELFTINVLIEGRSHCILSGATSKVLAQGESTTSYTVTDGRVEVRLQKAVAGEVWDSFIPDDEFGQQAPDAENIKRANEALQHLTSEKEEEGEVVPGFNSAQLEECDAAPPDTARLVRLSTSTHAPTHRVQLSAHQWICGVRLVPGATPALVLRHDVDALAWQPEMPTTDNWKFTHMGTFNAFGYVQASKEQKKFIICPPDLGFVAICESSEHVYLYHQPSALGSELRNRSSGRQVTEVARQQVVRTAAGQVMGAHATNGVLFLLFKNSLHALPIN